MIYVSFGFYVLDGLICSLHPLQLRQILPQYLKPQIALTKQPGRRDAEINNAAGAGSERGAAIQNKGDATTQLRGYLLGASGAGLAR